MALITTFQPRRLFGQNPISTLCEGGERWGGGKFDSKGGGGGVYTGRAEMVEREGHKLGGREIGKNRNGGEGG